MIHYILFFFTLLLLSGCSFKTPPNQFEYKSAAAFNSYTNNFLQANDLLAQNDLQRAITHAKKSANLTNLAKIYLGECALNISVGIHDSCENYKDIEKLVKNEPIKAYYRLLTSTSVQNDIQHLPKAYQTYAQSLQENNTPQLNTSILKINKTTSLLICAALSKKSLNAKTREQIIQRASHHGYKKAVLFWLEESLKDTNTSHQKMIQKRINILSH